MPKDGRNLTRRLLGWIMLAGMLVSILGCATKTVVIDTACTSFKTIWPSRQDVLTPGTKGQIIAHNETWEAHCGPVTVR